MSSFHFRQNKIHFKPFEKLSFVGQLRTRSIVHDELPGELFEGGSYSFNVGAERGELFKEIR